MQKQIAIFDAWLSDSDSDDSDTGSDDDSDGGSDGSAASSEEDEDAVNAATAAAKAAWVKHGIDPKLAARMVDCGDEQLTEAELNAAVGRIMFKKRMVDEDHEDWKEIKKLAWKVTDMRDAARRRDEVNAMLGGQDVEPLMLGGGMSAQLSMQRDHAEFKTEEFFREEIARAMEPEVELLPEMSDEEVELT
jgi:hypothetical protein